MTRTLVGAVVLAALMVLLSAAPAGATDPVDAPSSAPTPPAPDRAALDALDAAPDGVPGARRDAPCPSPTPPSGTGFGDLPPGPDPADAWVDGRGEGQLVAVVDTGVAAHPRLAGRVVDGGDFVAGASGLDDCDGHGTAVAGVIAASPGPDDLVVGLAPAARVLAVRQTSAFFGATGAPGSATSTSLARAVRHAADTPGVGVITLPLAACTHARRGRRPVRRARPRGPARGRPRRGRPGRRRGRRGGQHRPGLRPEHRRAGAQRPRARRGSATTCSPWARSTTPAPPTRRSLAGPWVDLAAPGREPSSLAARGAGLTTTLGAPDGASGPLVGTSFAAARVAAAAALLRQRSPETPAREIAAALVRSATPPPGLTPGVRDDAVGYGVLDAAAAVRGGPPRTGPEVRARAAGAPGGGVRCRVGSPLAVGAVAAVVAVGAVAARRRRSGAR